MDCGHQLELIPEAKDATMRYKSVMGKEYTGKANPMDGNAD